MLAGIFGAHRFYLGQWWGIFYLLFCWTYIPWFVGFIEGIVFLSTSQEAWNKRYNQGIFAGTEKGTVVVALALVFPVIAVLGILAAIAIPAYSDYTTRAKLTEGHLLATPAMAAVEKYAAREGEWPKDIEAVGMRSGVDSKFISSMQIEDGVVYVTVASESGASGEIIYVPTSTESGVTWSCKESTVPVKFLPAKCRP